MVNPFDLTGPAFLLFYAIVAALTLTTAWLARRWVESRATDGPLLSDYLDIAYLRGGPSEALLVATLNLINRGLIGIVGDGRVQTTDAKTVAIPAKRSERQVLERFRDTATASAILSDAALKGTARDDCEPMLVRLGLLPDDAANTTRHKLLGAAVFVLLSVAGVKIILALARGRSNIELLIVEAVIAVVLSYKVTHPPRMPAGDAQLSNLRSLFAGLQDRASSLVPGVQSHDFALLAAVFGISAIPSSFGFAPLFPKASATSSASCGSCGSSSCGGGGCGGGCGGCGS